MARHHATHALVQAGAAEYYSDDEGSWDEDDYDGPIPIWVSGSTVEALHICCHVLQTPFLLSLCPFCLVVPIRWSDEYVWRCVCAVEVFKKC